MERFIAIITEHFAGKWPFWISPRQVLVIPVAIPYVSFRLYDKSLQTLMLLRTEGVCH